MNQSEFLEKVRGHNKKIDVIGPYRGSRMPVEVRCRRCGRTWFARPDAILAGHGCRRCAKLKTQEQFVKDVARVSPNIEVIGRYVASKERVAVRCRTCGREWSPIAQNLAAGHGCPSCSQRKARAAGKESAEG